MLRIVLVKGSGVIGWRRGFMRSRGVACGLCLVWGAPLWYAHLHSCYLLCP
jgi:hypothetical protein